MRIQLRRWLPTAVFVGASCVTGFCLLATGPLLLGQDVEVEAGEAPPGEPSDERSDFDQARDSDAPHEWRFEFYDPLALAIALEPAIATGVKVDLEVWLEDDEFLGETSETGGPGQIRLAKNVDAARFFGLLEGLLELEGLTAN